MPLEVQPVVVAEREGDPRERNLELGMSWFQHQDEWAALPADDGPADWQRIEVAPDPAQVQEDRVDVVTPTSPIETVALDPVVVSDVQLGEQDLRFRVDRVGVPVLVRMSYFPNWQVDGAEGPYRVAPNLMVVIPTSNDVHLTFERSGLDVLAYVLTLAGVVLLVVFRRLGDADVDAADAAGDDVAGDDGNVGGGRVGDDRWAARPGDGRQTSNREPVDLVPDTAPRWATTGDPLVGRRASAATDPTTPMSHDDLDDLGDLDRDPDR